MRNLRENYFAPFAVDFFTAKTASNKVFGSGFAVLAFLSAKPFNAPPNPFELHAPIH
ncbi:hypothetical protein Cabys_1876 [Caldithrix abyssi DSM 13497]|uniref:Uncharacterized protein n=1 Tax=Caldithrix abyssi DSM 13497 TaxID=880073 RepID=A0A1J1C8M5_CALAY|nr:hypothetical protein Cabys_1876 [Caldithrix abyssi DSM 13497]